MKEFELKYGCNPNQKPSKIYMKDGSELPIEILCGRPGYINFLDAFNSWQLVKELKAALMISRGLMNLHLLVLMHVHAVQTVCVRLVTGLHFQTFVTLLQPK